MKMLFDSKDTKKSFKIKSGNFTVFHLPALGKLGIGNPEKLPFSIKVILESALRNCDGQHVNLQDIEGLLNWTPKLKKRKEIAFNPGRVILQDFTGVPCVVDLAAMRSAMKSLGGDYRKINSRVRCDLIIDHSLQVDYFGTAGALNKNTSLEFKRNRERYEFLKWGKKAFKNFNVIPPATGIIHQINLEYLATGVLIKRYGNGETIVYPDSVVGTDSHTTMINGMGIMGWGVGGIEAEAVMLGEPIYMLMPDVVGFELKGSLRDGVTATDMVLTVVQMLRQKGVVGKFVEFFGNGIKQLSLPDRAVISNMCPEYGATIGIFPIDKEVLDYYRLTGRSKDKVDLLERYVKEQGMFYSEDSVIPEYTDILELDLSTIEPCLAGPKRPQDRITLANMKKAFARTMAGIKVDKKPQDESILDHGDIVLAAITSCTNTSNPSLLIGAGLLAKKAVEKGLNIKKYVKTSFTPGSQVVEQYMREAGLLAYLEKLKFYIVGYGCATCIGNSGPLSDDVVNAIQKDDLVVCSVLSGNRNFEGRISPYTKANYLASPALVVAYAIAGSVNIDLNKEPVGEDKYGNDVYLKDIWPAQKEIEALVSKYVTAGVFRSRYKNINEGDKNWNAIKEIGSDFYQWNEKSTYIQHPPFFSGMKKIPDPIGEIKGARVIVMVGDSITTDHISPAGVISEDSPAGKYLIKQGVRPVDFNTYGSRRGNDRVMARGTFANIRLRNQLAPGTEGSWTTYFPESKKMTIFDAALVYKKGNVPLIVIAGKEYGTGSSRDWAAKGTALLGIRVVLAQSFERIHRSNLAGMGVLPLEFKAGESAETLGLKGDETFDFNGIDDNLKPGQIIIVDAKSTSLGGKKKQFKATVRLDTPIEIDYFRNEGILQRVLRKLR